MWSVLNGTVVNVFTVALGSLCGLSIGAKLPPRYRQIVLNTLGLVTIALGIDAAVLGLANVVAKFAPLVGAGKTYGARLAAVMIASLLLGAIIGTALRLNERIESAGAWVHRRFSARDGHAFAGAFLAASVIFCVGPLTVMGCLENGAHGNPRLLYIKALLDGFCSLALASSLGWGVFAGLLTVLFFQGGLSILAYLLAEPLNELSVALMTAVGGVILLATALVILDVKKIPVADLLPGIFLPPLVINLAEWVSPGLLLPSA